MPGRYFRRAHLLMASGALLVAPFWTAPALAQPMPSSLVSVCSGVSLPPSVVTDIMGPVVTGIYDPIETNVNDTLGALSPIVALLDPLPSPLSVDVNGLLTTAASGSDIGLSVLAQDGTLVGPGDPCFAQADGYTLDTPAGISIGGNNITGLGATGEEAQAGEIDSVAIGNNAATDAAAVGSIALGTDATIGAGGTGSVALGTGSTASVANSVALGADSDASRGSLAGYVAFGLSGTQDSAGEVSVGSPGQERQITNVAPGSALTDAVNLAQLVGATQAGTNADEAAVKYLWTDTNTDGVVDPGEVDFTSVILAGGGGTVISNLADGAVSLVSSEAVNGSQLYGVSQSVADNLGGGSVVNLDGTVSAPSYDIGGTIYNDVGSAIAAAGQGWNLQLNGDAASNVAPGDTVQFLDGQNIAVTRSGTDITISTTPDLVADSLTAGGTVLNATGLTIVGGPSVTVGGINGGGLVISNVAAGVAADDVATVGQLNALAGSIPTNAVEYDDGTLATVTLGGASGTTITNVADGALNATSSDAVNGSQLYATNQQVQINSLAIANLQTDVAGLQVQINNINSGASGPAQYSDPGTPTVPNGGVATNDVTLVGAAAGPVGLHNIDDGVIAAGSTDAVNGGQLFLTNQSVVVAQDTADEALVLGNNSVQYDGPSHTSVTFNPGGTAVSLHNIAAGTATTDAVNVGQLNSAVGNAVTQANAYTDARIAALDFDISNLRKEVNKQARAGTAAALAAAGMPQPMEPGKTMVAAGVGTYRGRAGFAIGASHAPDNGKSVFKVGLTYDSSEHVGANAGVGFQF